MQTIENVACFGIMTTLCNITNKTTFSNIWQWNWENECLGEIFSSLKRWEKSKANRFNSLVWTWKLWIMYHPSKLGNNFCPCQLKILWSTCQTNSPCIWPVTILKEILIGTLYDFCNKWMTKIKMLHGVYTIYTYV